MALALLDTCPPEKAALQRRLFCEGTAYGCGRSEFAQVCFSAILAEKSEARGLPVCLKQSTVPPSAGTISLKCLQTGRRVIAHVMQGYVHSLCWTLLDNDTQAGSSVGDALNYRAKESCLTPLTELCPVSCVLCSGELILTRYIFFSYNLCNRALLCLIFTLIQEIKSSYTVSDGCLELCASNL